MEIKRLFIENFVSLVLGSILTILFLTIKNRLISSNQEFFKTIKDFTKLLPSKTKSETVITNDFYIHLDLTTLNHKITDKEIDMFLRELERINYEKIIWKSKEITNFSHNIQRIIKTSTWDDFLIGILNQILSDKEIKNRKIHLVGSFFYSIIKC
jgi:hypothetical protein